MTTKGNKCLALKGHVNEIEFSCLVGSASHIGFFAFSKFGFPRYVFSHEMEIYASSKSKFLVTISLTLNYVPYRTTT